MKKSSSNLVLFAATLLMVSSQRSQREIKELIERIKPLAKSWTPYEYEAYPFKDNEKQKGTGLLPETKSALL